MFSIAIYLYCIKMWYCEVIGKLFPKRQILNSSKLKEFADNNRFVPQTSKNLSLFGKGLKMKLKHAVISNVYFVGVLTHYHTMPHFDALKIYSCGKHCEKRRKCLLRNKQFLLFSQCFLPHMALIFILNAL